MAQTTQPATGQSFTSRLIGALDRVWADIQHRHPDVPDVIVTVGSGTIGTVAGETRLGHFAADRWQRDDAQVPELFVGGEGLRHGPADLLATLLHEAAHGVAAVRRVKDTSRQGRYHNRRYKALAEELGLVITEDTRLGWTGTTLAEDTKRSYATSFVDLRQALTAWRHAEPAKKTGTAKKKNNGVVAECGCPRQFRITLSVLDAGPILCEVCEQPFVNTTPVDDDEATADED